MSKHTPGPWHSVDYCGYFNIQREPYYDSGNENLLNMEECNEAQANAKLCAVAPDLLEVALSFPGFNCLPHSADKMAEWVIKLDNAIQKATT